MISELIEDIHTILRKRPDLENKLYSPKLLIRSLTDLMEMAELDKIKEIISEQVRSYIYCLCKDTDFRSIGHHNIFYGPPGVGKSTIARCIARIFKGLGVFEFMKKNVISKTVNNSKKINISYLSEIKPQVLELYNHYCLGKSVPVNIIKSYWESLKTLLNLEETTRKIIPIEDDNDIIICGREDFIAGFSGQSVLKTVNFLTQHLGKCIIIEEAYLLKTGDSDGYGMEALTTINKFIEEHSDQIMVILTGYKDLINENIFKSQPGLKRRFKWIMEIVGYTPEGLLTIFLKQLKEDNWEISPDVDLHVFFRDNYEMFPYFGGDTDKFAYLCKTLHASRALMDEIENSAEIPIISKQTFLDAFERYKLVSGE